MALHLWGHRGICNQTIDQIMYKENSRQALQKALSTSLDGIEVDVQLTQDGYLVVEHDPQVEKYVLQDTSLETLKASILPDVLVIEEVLTMVGQTSKRLNIEIKSMKIAHDLATICNNAMADGLIQHSQLLVSSFHIEALETFSNCSNIELGCLADSLLDLKLCVQMAKKIDAKWLHISKELLDQISLDSPLLKGFQIGVFTYDSEQDIPHTVRDRIDAAFIDSPFDRPAQ